MFRSIALLACAATLIATNAQGQDYPKLNLRFAHYINANTPQSEIDQWWASEIEKRSGGNIKITFFWSESLGKSTEILDLVGKGGVELGSTSPAYFPSRLPYSALTHLPMLLNDNKQAQIVQTDLMEHPALQTENKRARVHALFWHSLPTYHLLCTKPVRRMDDFKGLRVRSFGEYVPVMWNSLGAVGVNVLAPEIYEGLQRGNIDCTFLSYDTMNNYKLQETAKQLIDINFGAISAWAIYVGSDTWQSWSEATRKLFTDISKEAGARERDHVFASATTALDKMKAAGVQIVQFQNPEQVKATVPNMVDLWIANMKKRGHGENAQSVVDLLRARMAATQ
jgi:TRAP-type transport system periplasmic protein